MHCLSVGMQFYTQQLEVKQLQPLIFLGYGLINEFVPPLNIHLISISSVNNVPLHLFS